jgi:hypothetical protein
MKSLHWITTSMAALLLLVTSPLMGQLGKVHGTATEGSETLPGYSVRLRSSGAEIRRGMTDTQGKYEFALLPAGSYEVEIEENEVFYRRAFTVAPGETCPLKIDIETATAYDKEGNRIYRSTGTQITGEVTPLFTVDPIQPQVVTGEELSHRPDRGLEAALPSFSKITQRDAGDPLNIGGARSEGTAIYVDNVKVRGDFQVPQSAISQIALMNSGIPAEFGDATGGVILITTHNPGMKPYTGYRLSKAERKSIRARQKGSPKDAGLPTAGPSIAHS